MSLPSRSRSLPYPIPVVLIKRWRGLDYWFMFQPEIDVPAPIRSWRVGEEDIGAFDIIEFWSTEGLYDSVAKRSGFLHGACHLTPVPDVPQSFYTDWEPAEPVQHLLRDPMAIVTWKRPSASDLADLADAANFATTYLSN